MSFRDSPPATQLFYAQRVDQWRGGETPLTDFHQVWEQLRNDRRVGPHFEQQKVKYRRNMDDCSSTSQFDPLVQQPGRSGLEEGFHCSWDTSTNRLTLLNEQPFVRPHPITGLLFNIYGIFVPEAEMGSTATKGSGEAFTTEELQAMKNAIHAHTVNHKYQANDIVMVDNHRPVHGVTKKADFLEHQALGIAVPGSKVDDGLAARELQSLADGQVVLDPSRSRFPAIEPGASFSRFGLGSTSGPEAKARDVRPPALQVSPFLGGELDRSDENWDLGPEMDPVLTSQAVAAHLRTLLALESEARFRPAEQEVDRHQTRQMECVAAALRQPADAPLLWQEMTALLLAASSGALDTLPLDEAMDSLAGGSRSPLLLHLRDAAPGALQKITEEAQPSQSTIRELEVALRLFTGRPPELDGARRLRTGCRVTSMGRKVTESWQMRSVAKQALIVALLLEVYARHGVMLTLGLLAAGLAALKGSSMWLETRQMLWEALRSQQPKQLWRQAKDFCLEIGAVEVREVLEDEELCQELSEHLQLMLGPEDGGNADPGSGFADWIR
eukprot:g24957.t1